MFRSIGYQELTIVVVIVLIMFVPSVLGAWGFYRISKRAGYDSGASALWAVGFVFAGWIAMLLMGLMDWPRDKFPAPIPARAELPTSPGTPSA